MKNYPSNDIGRILIKDTFENLKHRDLREKNGLENIINKGKMMKEEVRYKGKKRDYFSIARKDIVNWIPSDKRKGNLLEVGAGNGATLKYIKEKNYAKKVFGIDLIKLEGQESELIDEFIVQDIEKEIEFKEKFDVILFLDILEHLKEPREVLSILYRYLNDDGVIITSIPNIREISTMKKIFLDGDFRYTETGILDRTHLRFYCKKNQIELLESAGYNVVKTGPNLSPKRKFINNLTLKIFEEFLTVQYYSLSIKPKEKHKKYGSKK